jgi:hypothetical protein
MSFGPSLADRLAPEIPVDGSGLAAVMRDDDRATARLTIAFGAFAAYGEWAQAGYANPAQWLKDKAGMTGADAYRMTQEAKKLRALPVTAEAWVNGELSGGQVRIICAQVIDRHLDLFAQHEASVVAALRGVSVDDTLSAMRLWRERADALNEGPAPDDRSTARLSSTLDNRGLLSANLDADGYATLKKALEIADSGDKDVSPALRRGEALTTVAKFFLDHQNKKLRTRNRPHVNVVINGATLGTDALEGYYAASGMRATPETLRRLLCDCDLHRMLHVDGEILDYGRGARLAPAALFQALVLRDGGCRFPGCDRPPEQCDVHHADEWQLGGTTNVWECVLGCGYHHTVLHKPGWTGALARDGTFTVTSPDGVVRTSKPRILTNELELVPRADPAPSRFADHLAHPYAGADLVIHFDRAVA